MAILFKNNAASTLKSIYTSSTGKFSDLYVADSSVFPSITAGTGDYFYLTLVGDDTLEIVKAFETGTNSSGGKYIRVYRAQEDTVQQDWPAGTRVEMRITAGALNSFVPTAVQLAKDYVDATGVASTTNVGFAGVDGKTTQADASGKITVKDVAIGGDASDLASARGFFYDTYLPYYPGRGSDPVDDFNLLTLPGTYHIVVSRDTLNRPDIRLFTGSGTNDGILEITRISSASTVSSHQRLNQRFTVFGSDRKTWSRNQNTKAVAWYAWEQEIRTSDIGDGIRITNGIISVPEMEGAATSANGVSGLVPPPLKADLGKSLGADGEWTYPADVAVGGDVNDLASARGQIGNPVYTDAVDFNTYTKAGFYSLKNVDAAENAPPISANGHLIIHSDGTRIRQIYYRIGTVNSNDWQIFTRSGNSSTGRWSDWIAMLTERNLGDGLKISNYKVSVPEYEGATASAAGTSGLVPPAAAGQHESFLTGGGEYKPALTKISDSVSLKDSTTAASAKAVKTAYDRGSSGIAAAKTAQNGITKLREDVPSIAAYAAGPNARFINLTEASFPFTAPETGWVRAVCTATEENRSFMLETSVFIVNSSLSSSSGQSFNAIIPVTKGQKVNLYLGTYRFDSAYFVYANGAVPA